MIIACMASQANACGFNGTGLFINCYNWTNDAANGIPITASRFDTQDGTIATGLSTTITKDGQQTTTARIPFAFGLSFDPAYGLAVTNDLTTGIFQTNGAGTLSIQSAGSQVAAFDGNGLEATAIGVGTASTGSFTNISIGTAIGIGTSVSIGTPTSNGYALYVQQAGSNQAYFGSTGSNASNIFIDSPASQASVINFSTAMIRKWQIFKDNSGALHIADSAASSTLLNAVSGGTLTLGQAQNLTIDSLGDVSIGTNLAIGNNTTIGGTLNVTGNVTMPTQSVGNSSTKGASTAFVNPGSSLIAAGYRKNPDGSIMEWGNWSSSGSAGNAVAISFPLAFPNAVFAISPACQGAVTANGATWYDTPTVNGFNGRSAFTGTTCSYIAIGN